MNHTESSCIRESYAAVLRLRASVVRADQAIAKSRRLIEEYQASLRAMMDGADEEIADLCKRTIKLHHPSQLAATNKKASHSDARQIAARIAKSFREAGFGCELLGPLPLH